MGIKDLNDPKLAPLSLIPQELDATWRDLGPVINVGDTNTLSLYLDIDVNDSIVICCRMLSKIGEDDTREYLMPIRILGANKELINPHYMEFNITADEKYVVDFDVKSLFWVKFQVLAGVPGATPGRILTAYALKV